MTIIRSEICGQRTGIDSSVKHDHLESWLDGLCLDRITRRELESMFLTLLERLDTQNGYWELALSVQFRCADNHNNALSFVQLKQYWSSCAIYHAQVCAKLYRDSYQFMYNSIQCVPIHDKYCIFSIQEFRHVYESHYCLDTQKLSIPYQFCQAAHGKTSILPDDLRTQACLKKLSKRLILGLLFPGSQVSDQLDTWDGASLL